MSQTWEKEPVAFVWWLSSMGVVVHEARGLSSIESRVVVQPESPDCRPARKTEDCCPESAVVRCCSIEPQPSQKVNQSVSYEARRPWHRPAAAGVQPLNPTESVGSRARRTKHHRGHPSDRASIRGPSSTRCLSLWRRGFWLWGGSFWWGS